MTEIQFLLHLYAVYCQFKTIRCLSIEYYQSADCNRRRLILMNIDTTSVKSNRFEETRIEIGKEYYMMLVYCVVNIFFCKRSTSFSFYITMITEANYLSIISTSGENKMKQTNE